MQQLKKWTDYKRAEDSIRFLERFVKMPDGKPVRLFEWEREYIRELLVEDGEGRRKHSRGVLSCARKSGKTTLIALLAVIFLAGPCYVKGTRILVAANSRDQAKILFRMVTQIMKASTEINETFEFQTGAVFSEFLGCNIVVVPAKESTIHGEGANLILVDEISQAPDLSIFDTLCESTIARPNSLVIALSTLSQKAQNPLTELEDKWIYARNSGISMDHWHMKIFRADKDGDIYSDEALLAANPSCMEIPGMWEELCRKRDEAKLSPGSRSRYRAYTLNIPSNLESAMVDPEAWAQAKHPDGIAHLQTLYGSSCILSVDLARSHDITSISSWHPDPDEYGGFLSNHPFLPSETIDEESQKSNTPWMEWVRDGHLTSVPGKIIDYRFVARKLKDFNDRFNVHELRYDAWQIEALTAAMAEIGLSIPMVAMRQGYKTFSPAITRLENLLMDERIQHCGNPVATYCMLNAMTQVAENSPSEERRIIKPSAQARIDCAVSSVMAIGDGSAESRMIAGVEDLIFGGEDELRRVGLLPPLPQEEEKA